MSASRNDPGAVRAIGILGGGQLGRMLTLAAARLGLRTHIFCPPGDAPAIEVAHAATRAEYDDHIALTGFAEHVDVVTYEFENVPAQTVAILSKFVPVRPGAKTLAAAQDRLIEKDFLSSIGAETVPYRAVNDIEGLRAGIEALGTPCILKTRRMGYDGKGQVRIDDAEQAAEAFAAIDGKPAILEGFADFDREISVIGARGADGRITCYDPGVNVHCNHILHTTTVPAGIDVNAAWKAIEIASSILDALDYIGVIGVELFHMSDGRMLVNEIAPRVHNSGHWTLEACAISQFEQHIRAVCDWPLGDPSRHSDARMTNLIGVDIEAAAEWAAKPRTGVHLYGKAEVRAGRKMGHATEIFTLDELAGLT